jgi:serine phosphatase RsbU (regulator of sigma subunit)
LRFLEATHGIIARFYKASAALITLIGLVTVGFLAVFDISFDRDLSFLLLYIAPVLFVAWFAGARNSYAIACSSALVWVIDDLVNAQSYARLTIPIWNLATKLLILVVFGHIGARFRDAVEREKMVVQESARREMAIAKDVQELLFPDVIPRLDTLTFSVHCLPAQEIGGDYYDFIPLDSRRLAIVVADVAGKGVAAALLMARLQGLVRSTAVELGAQVTDFVTTLNQEMMLRTGRSYVTLFYACYDDETRELRYSNAGHPPPLLVRAPNGTNDEFPERVALLESGGPVIGLLPNAVFQESSVRLGQGDVLTFYTDGISETTNTKDEEFGDERLRQTLLAHADLAPAELQERIFKELDAFRGAAPQHDDMTLVIAKAV